jgi:hypothetical protein
LILLIRHAQAAARYDVGMQRVPELVVGLTLLTAPYGMMAQQSAAGGASLSSEEDEASYEIYSTVLKAKEPLVLDWTIVRETRAFNMCLEPARDQQLIYRPMIDDYAFKNRKTWVLQRKFNLGAYTLVGPEAWASTTGNTKNRTLAVLSAVGFNGDRTRALLCFWAKTSGTCDFIVKQEAKWQIDRSWRGSACGWAY